VNRALRAAKRIKAALAGGLYGEIIGRGDRIRTYDLYVPNVALYQTELHPDTGPLCGGPRMIAVGVVQRNVSFKKTVSF
jgi:hypothetical protein